MNTDEYRVMYEIEDHFWWYRGLRRILFSLIERYKPEGSPLRVLDAGCGTGAMLSRLGRVGDAVGVDLSSDALSFCRKRGVDAGRLAQASVEDLPFAAGSFDLLTSLDVLCNVPDDQRAFAEFFRVLRPGGVALVNLPAYHWLYSEHDAAVYVIRRYRRSEVVKKLRQAGFHLTRATYANMLLFPPAALIRLIKKPRRHDRAMAHSDLNPLPAPLNAILAGVFASEAALIQRGDLPFGLSVLTIARKPETGP